jgi:hypothetical protein
MFSQSPVAQSSEGDDQCTGRFIVIWVSSIVRLDKLSKCALGFFSKCSFSKYSSESSTKCASKCSTKTQSAVFHAVEVSIHPIVSNHMLILRVVIVLARNCNGICDIWPTGRPSRI